MTHTVQPSQTDQISQGAKLAVNVTEYQARRRRVQTALEGAVGIVYAGDAHSEDFQVEPSFFYLTGIANEPGAILLFDAKAENPERACVLFLKPRDIELEAWEGYRDPINSALKSRHGFDTVQRTSSFSTIFSGAIRRSKRAACLHQFARHEAPVSPDLVTFRKAAERIPGVTIEDKTDLLARLRAIKGEEEVAIMRAAMRATKAGYDAAARTIKPGANETDVTRAITRAFEDAGGDGHAYGPIVGTGANACVLHYRANNAPILANQVLVIDAGTKVAGYHADVTRAFPTSGTFSDRQKYIYNLVLEAQLASIAAVKPGVTMYEVDKASRDIFRREKLQDAYLHGIGHQLGLETHDITPDGPLQPGMVITIEPGLYLLDEALGVRIEDDVLVTHGGCEVLTRDIPKTADEVERWMRE